MRRRGLPSLRPGGSLAGPGSLVGQTVPWDRRLALLLVPLLLLPLLLWARDDEQTGLDHWVLAGPRGPSCLRLTLANDVSGSMSEYAAAREGALATLLAWLPRNLRADDELAVVDFAQAAATVLEPTPASRLVGRAPGGAGASDGTYTWLAPVLNEMDGWDSSRCDVALVLLSDAQLVVSARGAEAEPLPFTPGQGRELMRRHDIHDVRLLVPDPSIKVPQIWTEGFPEAQPHRFHGLDRDETAKAVAGAIADLTGQKLEKT